VTTLAHRASGLADRAGVETPFLAALALGPIWPVVLGFAGRLTVGRLLLALCIVTLVGDVLRRGWGLTGRAVRPLVFVACLAGLVGWAVLSAATWGCFCAGSVGGLAETAMVASLAAIVALREPARSERLLWAAGFGIGLGAAIAAAGISVPRSALEGEAGGSGRLEGVYGNPNALGYAVAFVVPLIVVRIVRAQGRGRALWAILGLAAAGVLLLTFSRGGLIAAAAGGFTAALLSAPPRGRRFVLGGALLLVAIGAGSYPYLAEARRDVEVENRLSVFASARADLQARDRSGWDGTAQGPIPGKHAQLRNVGAALRVRAVRAGQGVSYEWGQATPVRTYELHAGARADSSTPLSVALGDNLEGNGPVRKTILLGGGWQRVALRWRPLANSPAARAYFWTESKPVTFDLRDIEIVSRGPTSEATMIPIDTRLLGSEWEQLRAEIGDPEADYLSSRAEAARLSLRAVVDHPLLGLGWEEFPAYSESRSEFGRLSTHNEYLRFASELGIVGVLLLLIAGSIVVVGLVSEPSPLRAELAGVLTAGAVGLMFINGLAVAAASIPLAVAAGLATAAPPRQRRS
jgi:O-antigen ligase